MDPINDRPEDRAARRTITLCIVVGAALGALFGVPRYGPVAIGTAALMGLGVMVVLGLYALFVALRPAAPLDDGPDPPSP
jgi:hypothetical protein